MNPLNNNGGTTTSIMEVPKIYVTRTNRGAKKVVTYIENLSAYYDKSGINEFKALVSKRCACGSSICLGKELSAKAKLNPKFPEDIVVQFQGDCGEQIVNILTDTTHKFDRDNIVMIGYGA